MHSHEGCCGCSSHSMGRRSFLASVGGGAAATAILSGCETVSNVPIAAAVPAIHRIPSLKRKCLTVQPALTCQVYERREATSWRPWGGLHTNADIEAETARITADLKDMQAKAEFPLEIRPVVRVSDTAAADALREGDADVMLVYGAAGEIEPLISPKRHNIVFVRHKSGPVYLWYEIAHPRLLRKTVDEWGQPGLEPMDVVVDSNDDVLWRLRALSALKSTVGCRIVAIGDASGWGAGGQNAPKIAAGQWKMDIRPVSYDELGPRIQAARADAASMKRAEAAAAEYLKLPRTKLETKHDYVVGAFVLRDIFVTLMAEHDAPAMTINNCMSAIMPMSNTTACLTLSVINDDGMMAFCESDFVVIPSGVLLHYISSVPVFLQDPTYPHHGVITLAHCTAPRRMNGRKNEPVRLMTHFESDYGAAPKVDMTVGQTVTVIDPDFENKKWVGFRGTIKDNPFLDICRSQVDVAIEGDCDMLAQEMRGFHWMLAYGDHLKETGYALHKLGVPFFDLTANRLA